MAHQLAGVPNLMVEIFRSGAFPELGQWQLRLRNEPSDRNQRNDYLRRVTDALGKIAGAAGAASPNA